MSKRDLVITASVDKLLSGLSHYECLSRTTQCLGLSSTMQIKDRPYHWKLRDQASKFRTAF